MSIEELEQRLTALENRMEMQETLRAAGDLDLADLTLRVSAIHRMVQALAITQSDHSRILREHSQTLDQHTQMHTATHGKLNTIIEMLNRLQG